jgi:hypothetical protein
MSKPRPARWRHRTRGTTYTEVGRASLQKSSRFELHDNDEMVVYRSDDDGSLWCRLSTEFEDGRFEPLSGDPPEASR